MKSHFEPKLAFSIKESAKIIFGSDDRSHYQKVNRLIKSNLLESITFPGNGGRQYVTRKALINLIVSHEHLDDLIKKISE